MKVHPYLNFDGNTEEAFAFYRSVFGGDYLGVVRFRDFGGEGRMPADMLDKIANIALPIGNDTTLMASDGMEAGERVRFGNNVHILLEPDSAEETDRLFAALSEGGTVPMQLQQTEWAEKYGMVTDRFGVQWMLNFTGDVQFQPGGER